MSQISGNCGCNDYALFEANTGIQPISTANSSLTGAGATLIITGAANGTIIKSVIIKNTDGSVLHGLLNGMVRLFIGNTSSSDALVSNALVLTLYREVPIPTFPVSRSIPVPIPIYPLLEIDLILGFKLQSGYGLYASTQTASTFNIIAQGIDFTYPQTLPTVCCNFKQETVINGLGTVTIANPNTDGSGELVDLYTVSDDANGAVIKSITVAALGCTHPGMVRFFISPDEGDTYYLWMEVYIPESIQSGFTPSLKRVLPEDFYLESDYIIAASTQNAESFAITIEGEEWVYAS